MFHVEHCDRIVMESAIKLAIENRELKAELDRALEMEATWFQALRDKQAELDSLYSKIVKQEYGVLAAYQNVSRETIWDENR